jgi:CubicO group peptidase (beta-lactamase class C family)
MSIAEYAERLAELPLLYQPGTVWDYGRSTDVLGALIEAVSGTTLDAYMRERVLVPLGMSDSGFWVPESERHRVAEPLSDTLIDITAPPAMLAGGHGIVSTVMDYARFCQMMLEEGSLDGVRILGSETVAYMTADHLGDINRDGTVYLPGPGYGFGLGFAVRTHAGRSRWPGSVGEYFWGGYAGTYFWVDPTKEMIVVYMMQSVKQRGHYRMILRNLVNQAIMD